MNCEQCSKNPATYHLTAIEKKEKAEKHLCEECAKNAGANIGVLRLDPNQRSNLGQMVYKPIRVSMTDPAVALIERLAAEFRAGLYTEAAQIAQKRLAREGLDKGPVLEEDAQEAWDNSWD